ncbi:hypothetical protein GCM10027259_07760 [Micromonospora palomenae]|uniref:DUF429 domain-containing protein n=1 Tax=Micromonospora palomenae TaxID=1461247 RepID=UPI001FE6BCAA|nr:DUF429 domain-containing protein [Micromonospora palomenae]
MSNQADDTYGGAVLTLGVDLAARDKRTAMATVEWLSDRAVVRDLVLDVSDARIVEASRHVEKIGLDCPSAGRNLSSRSSRRTSRTTSSLPTATALSGGVAWPTG